MISFNHTCFFKKFFFLDIVMIVIKVLVRTENLPPQYLERRWGRRSWRSTGSTVAWCLLAWVDVAITSFVVVRFPIGVFCDLRVACCKLKDVVSVHHEWVSPSRHWVIVSSTWPIQVEYPISWWMFAKNLAMASFVVAMFPIAGLVECLLKLGCRKDNNC